MNYKIQGALKRNKKYFIMFGILWIFLAIVFVVPIAYSKFMVSLGESRNGLEVFITTFGKIFSEGATEDYLLTLAIFTIFYLLFFFIGIFKSAPKNEYSDIEHGSSDWSQGGEQYQILNKNKGIVLAEDNYLPVDKRGNVNVLVVGRIRFW